MALAICSLVLKYHRQQIIKIVIIGGDPRVAGHDCFREHGYSDKPNNLKLI